MLKKERLLKILEIVDQQEIVTVNELITTLGVSDMTIRRDLDELDKSGKLIRLHGGAQKIANIEEVELSRNQKKELHLVEKQEVAKLAAQKIKSGDTIYIGAGTTLELIVNYVEKPETLRIVTNSLPVFEAWQKTEAELILVGGNYRRHSGEFIGGLTIKLLEDLKFTKAFVGVNGVNNDNMMAANTEEGQAEALGLNNAQERYVVMDKYKFNRNDFYNFYSLYNVDALLTNSSLAPDTLEHYQVYTKIEN
ncbi:DeoR/GlpR transcriptional regulator [Ligilactobacillus murinus]|uniref:DeoR/GlpR family DNA-binding transcription regulator n=1 Tax=Ligilactobacillus murinus TaxID=1622 RepID=UPI001072EB5B|nr:DeoR/GlpR family DNA-binding transcription regulator [Ligilactobacillus murinus]MBF0758596.1 DeoR/GlpR transcriptional regulator [Ligilactobacillus murinus]MBF0833094.1 DeoR/GlpR transcriptional regulator [Ligilactobacillus murinus]TFU63852.1 DeoR/GlpR transcriptional regulator [Ligilactobacillus murinus]WRY37559.1 DeoR/GlpR family DNA-binding transcription regulator [Ligilactobacillus murinus]